MQLGIQLPRTDQSVDDLRLTLGGMGNRVDGLVASHLQSKREDEARLNKVLVQVENKMQDAVGSHFSALDHKLEETSKQVSLSERRGEDGRRLIREELLQHDDDVVRELEGRLDGRLESKIETVVEGANSTLLRLEEIKEMQQVEVSAWA